MSGSIVPESSDEAKRRGTRPPEGSFNPEELSHWSITMTIAWIAWRDVSIVREEWDDYRLECADWMFIGKPSVDEIEPSNSTTDSTLQDESAENWLLIPHRPSYWFFLKVRESTNKPGISLKNAQRELWKVAGMEDLVATAIQCPKRFTYNGAEVTIQGASWQRLSPDVAPSGHATLLHDDGRWFRDVSFARADVKRIWPQLESAPAFTQISPHERPVAKSDSLTTRISLATAARIFKEYRETYEVISTEAQDINFMRQYGISRDWVRTEREKYPKLPRGRVKKSAE